MKLLYGLLLSVLLVTVTGQARPLVICVDGLTGVGKSTFVRLLEERIPEAEIAYEPAEQWLNIKGHGGLWQLFFKEPARWAFSMETYISFVRMKELERTFKACTKNVLIVDRSLYLDRFCYGPILKNQGAMSPLEWAMYQDWFDWIEEHTPRPDGFIYLQPSSAEITMIRIAGRERAEEKNFPIALQQAFHTCYENFFIQKKGLPAHIASIPVLALNADNNFKSDKLVRQNYMHQVQQFINSLKTTMVQHH